ncbi:hypothetical protein EYF80_056295 [Liparis tanakae]|uniref:Uncharacterized protein n=1 Tax=Liparis tanakae TaxID=230148 RepID=A0A4Z2EZ84_9TELE|nr:hypothetical protein EYF80_056295 [Liparis tanakae]
MEGVRHLTVAERAEWLASMLWGGGGGLARATEVQRKEKREVKRCSEIRCGRVGRADTHMLVAEECLEMDMGD